MSKEDKILIVDKESVVVLTDDFEVIDAIEEFPDIVKKECYEALEKDKDSGIIKVFTLKTPPIYIVLFKFVKEGQEGLLLISSREKIQLSRYLDILERNGGPGEEIEKIRQMLKAVTI